MAATPVTYPHTFHADPAYRYGSVLFSLTGVIGMGLALSRHDTRSLLLIALPFLVFLAAILLTNTFRLTVDERGLHQWSLLGRKEATWEQVQRLDFALTYALYGASSKELVWMSMLSVVDQQVIADEAIRQAGLRVSDAKMVFPMQKQWVR